MSKVYVMPVYLSHFTACCTGILAASVLQHSVCCVRGMVLVMYQLAADCVSHKSLLQAAGDEWPGSV